MVDMRIDMKIFLSLLLVAAVTQATPIVYADLFVYENGNVEKNTLKVTDGRVQLYTHKEQGEYMVRILDGENNIIWSESKEIYFDYSGPVIAGMDINYSEIRYGKVNMVSRIPYTSDMKTYQLLHNDEVIFSEMIVACNRNGICDEFENERDCSDCVTKKEEVNLIVVLIVLVVLALVALVYWFSIKQRGGGKEERILRRVRRGRRR